MNAKITPDSKPFLDTGLPLFAGLDHKVRDLSDATVRFGRKELDLALHEMPGLAALRPLAEELAKVVNPNVKSFAISVNTQHMSEDEAQAYIAQVEAEMGLPCTDPFRYGAGKLVDALG